LEGFGDLTLGSNALCTAVGNYYGISVLALFVSHNGGGSWSEIHSGLPSGGIFYATNCSGSGASAVCTAVGTDDQLNLLISMSQDGGTNWHSANIGATPGRFVATSCTGSGAQTICIAAGRKGSAANHSVLYVSRDAGVTWSEVPSNSYQLYGASCSGSGNNALCAAAGLQASSVGPAALYVSQDGGQSWSTPSTPVNSRFNSVNCVGASSSGLCVASGLNSTTRNALSFISNDGGQNWSAWIAQEPSSSFNSVQCTGTAGTSAVCVAVGRDTATQQPLVYVSSDGSGLLWSKKETESTNSTFNSVTCTGDGSSASCAAAGKNIGENSALLYFSQDGGAHWSNEASISKAGSLASVSCVGGGASLICSTAGDASPAPLLYQSTTNGASWQVIDLPTAAGYFNKASCTGSGLDAVCIAVGKNYLGNLPLLYRGVPISAYSWNWIEVNTGLTAHGLLNDVSCTGESTTSICSAVGYEIDNNILGAPILVVTHDGGLSWSRINTSLIKAKLLGSSCTGSDDNAICIAAGQDLNDPSWPSVLLVSRDAGRRWTRVDTGTNNQYLETASCSGFGSNAVCTAAGQGSSSSNSALIYLSQDGGQSWSSPDTSALTSNGEFLNTQCTGVGANTLCTASGQDYVTALPLLYVSQNAGQSWSAQPSLIAPGQGAGILYQTSCTGEAAQALCASAGVYEGDYPSYIYLGQSSGFSLLWSLITPSTYSGSLNSANCVGLGTRATCMIAGSEVNNLPSVLFRPSLYLSTNAGISWSAVSIDTAILSGKFNGLASTSRLQIE